MINASKNQFIQFLRGISIIAVVLTHSLGKAGVFPLLIKPWLYFQVMLFIFLSGYLTPIEKTQNVSFFYRRRLTKVLIPYFLWTIIYLMLDKNLSLYQLIRAIVRANAWGPLYFLHDYAQLVILTPVFYWMLQRKYLRGLLYLVTPLYIVFNYYLRSNGGYLLVPLCAWLILPYILGLEHKKWEKLAEKIPGSVVILLVIVFGLAETMESFLWRNAGVEAMANTQVKFTSLFYFLAVLLAIAKLSSEQKKRLIDIRPVVLFGDMSFGIYCCHGLFLIVLSRYIPKQMPYSILLWVLVLGCSAGVVYLGKFLPSRVCKWIGFV